MTRVVLVAAAVALTFGLSSCPSSKSRAAGTPTVSCAPSVNPITGIKVFLSLECSKRVAATLRRPLRLPSVAAGAACPITRQRTIHVGPGRTADYLLPGPGPAYPLLVMEYDRDGAVKYGSNGPKLDGWWDMKTAWWIDPRESGEVLVRARRLDGTSPIVMGNGPAVGRTVVTIESPGGAGTYSDENLLLTARDVANIINGWRNYPGATAIRTGGCYGFQVDGKTFSYSVVFKAIP